MSESQDVSQLLIAWKSGDADALEKIIPVVYDELRRLAASYLRQEKPEHTLQPTALVHEAYLRLIDQSLPAIDSRQQFFGVAARIMRQILVDHARHKRAAKRDGGRKVMITDGIAAFHGRSEDLLSLDRALTGLEQVDARKAKAVELQFFAGMSVEETAEVLSVSVATVHRELKLAEAWLYRKLRSRTDDAKTGKKCE